METEEEREERGRGRKELRERIGAWGKGGLELLLLFVVVVVSRVLCVLHQAGGGGRLPLFPLCATERRDRGRGRRERVRWEGDLAKGGRRCVRLLRVSFLRGVPGGKNSSINAETSNKIGCRNWNFFFLWYYFRIFY